jgi:hypothetical protein
MATYSNLKATWRSGYATVCKFDNGHTAPFRSVPNNPKKSGLNGLSPRFASRPVLTRASELGSNWVAAPLLGSALMLSESCTGYLITTRRPAFRGTSANVYSTRRYTGAGSTVAITEESNQGLTRTYLKIADCCRSDINVE